jgi:protease PrsW
MSTVPPSTPTGATLADLDDARIRAVEATGWGGRVAFFQPRQLAFWIWAALVAYGVWHQVHSTSQNPYYAPAISLAFGVFALYGALFWWFTQHIDRYASQPGLLRVMGFLWGAFAATFFIAAPANTALLEIYAKLFGQAFALDWGPALAAPFTEEWGKGLGLLLFIALAPNVIRTAYDGFILGAFIGLGFQILENVLYVANAAPSQFGAHQVGASLSTFAVRMSSGIASHILFTAIFCTGLVYLLGRPSQPRRIGRGIGLIVLAMGFHGLWDGQAALVRSLFGDGTGSAFVSIALLFGLPIVGVLIVIGVFKVAVVGERAYMRDMLAPEVARGVITDAELTAAAGDRKARRRYLRSERGHRRRRRHVLDAVFDLAAELGRAGGATTDRVAFARDEVRRTRAAAGA